MDFSGEEIEKLRPRVRFKVCYEVGFYCPDVDDIVQETLARFLVATGKEKIQNPAAVGAFLNGICRNVILEYRRRNMRDEPMPEVVPEPPGKTIPETDLFELRQGSRGRRAFPFEPRERRHFRHGESAARMHLGQTPHEQADADPQRCRNLQGVMLLCHLVSIN